MSVGLREILVGAVGVCLALLAVLWQPSAFQEAGSFFAALVVPERVTPETLHAKYEMQAPINVLVVPGHDDEFWGTEYRGLREADITLELAGMVRDSFAGDPRFSVTITREGGGYTEEFVGHFDVYSSLIWEFRDYARTVFASAVLRGDVVPKTENFHGFASSEIARRLYGVNMWANDHRVDVVLHVHFNDYPRARQARAGKYKGFSIYIPESQFPNARASRVIAEKVVERLRTALPISNYPQEAAGVVEDQELIAVGSYGSLYPASLLIEYGYIYEPHFMEPNLRTQLFPSLATLTYQGVVDFFEVSGFNGERNGE
ncbi:MAG: N-acetylmuramoyl-L-alanine amidase [Candidatus Brennerbacteria bacterium]